MLTTIVAILTGKIFYPTNSRNLNNEKFNKEALEFNNKITEKLKNWDTSIDSIANAILTLTTFNFEYEQENLASFVKDAVLPYLDNKEQILRKAAA